MKTVACQASLPIVFFHHHIQKGLSKLWISVEKVSVQLLVLLFFQHVNDDRIDWKSDATPEKFPLWLERSRLTDKLNFELGSRMVSWCDCRSGFIFLPLRLVLGPNSHYIPCFLWPFSEFGWLHWTQNYLPCKQTFRMKAMILTKPNWIVFRFSVRTAGTYQRISN